MITANKNRILVFLCMIIAITLCMGHVLGNRIILMLSIALFLGGIVFTSWSGKVLYLICFFLPWSPLIKFEPKTMSIYTVGLIAACGLTWIRYRISFRKYILPAILMIVLICAVRLYYDVGIDNSFIMFSIMLVLFPIIGEDLHKTYDFYNLNFFFSLGIIAAALSAYYLVKYPMIARFIDVHSVQAVTRYSGYYGDANFYSAHIVAALAGYLVMFGNAGKRTFISILMSIALLYCGLLSVSKTFVITAILVLFLWVFRILFIKKNFSYKVVTIAVIGMVGITIIASNLFSSLFDVIAIRFGNSSTLSDLTTGRSTIWLDYLRYFADNPAVIFFGNGYVNLLLDEHSTHNTLLQGVFQFGIVGCLILFFWLRDLFKITLRNVKMGQKHFFACLILVIGVFLPWMSIDLLFGDEFFLMMFYISLGFKWIYESSAET